MQIRHGYSIHSVNLFNDNNNNMWILLFPSITNLVVSFFFGRNTCIVDSKNVHVFTIQNVN